MEPWGSSAHRRSVFHGAKRRVKTSTASGAGNRRLRSPLPLATLGYKGYRITYRILPWPSGCVLTLLLLMRRVIPLRWVTAARLKYSSATVTHATYGRATNSPSGHEWPVRTAGCCTSGSLVIPALGEGTRSPFGYLDVCRPGRGLTLEAPPGVLRARM